MTDPAETEFTDDETPHALYRLYDDAGVLLYVGITWNLPQRMDGHSGDKGWWPQVARRTMIWYSSELDARIAEAIAIDTEKPLHNTIRPAVGPLVPPHGQRSGWHRTTPKSVRLPYGLLERVEAAAEAAGETVNAFIVAAIEEELARREALKSTCIEIGDL